MPERAVADGKIHHRHTFHTDLIEVHVVLCLRPGHAEASVAPSGDGHHKMSEFGCRLCVGSHMS